MTSNFPVISNAKKINKVYATVFDTSICILGVLAVFQETTTKDF